MKLKFLLIAITFSIAASISSPSFAEVQWSVLSRLNMKSSPIDVAISFSDKWIFVLDDHGDILVFSKDGKLKEKIQVGKQFDQIRVGPRDNLLFLTNSKSKTVEIIEVDFIYKINTTGSPFKGLSNAPVVLVVFTDFQCPYCAYLVPVLDQVLKQYPKEVKIVFKNYPLQSHSYAMSAAIAALAAKSQGKFWEFHDLLFKNHNQLSDEKVEEIIIKTAINRQEFEKKINDPQVLQKVQQDIIDGVNADVRGTPSVFINGKLQRNLSMEGLTSAIDKDLKESREHSK
ncbi:MAG: DsbA family protein [Proteobacteria bacterium]|nr:DsbA family protein [Pseudomonadota bacterium]